MSDETGSRRVWILTHPVSWRPEALWTCSALKGFVRTFENVPGFVGLEDEDCEFDVRYVDESWCVVPGAGEAATLARQVVESQRVLEAWIADQLEVLERAMRVTPNERRWWL